MHDQSTHDEPVVCSRCGREEQPRREGERNTWRIPEGWEGSVDDATCPGCQYAEWHPLCGSILDEDGQRVAHRTFEGEIVLEPAIAMMPSEEIISSGWSQCEYLDTTVSWIDGEDAPEWRCPRCGGTTFVGAHRDYPPSGIQPGGFEIGDES